MICYSTFKRGLDVIGAGIVLVVASPVMAATALAVGRKLGRPIIYVQDRPGQDGVVFRLYKFRSMKDVDHEAGLVSDDERLTHFGRWLRSTSFDELPSLVNVLKGDMSLVGPRPLLVSYLDRYSPEQARRHEVRPGITGLAQVSGRNLVTWEDRFKLDVEYVNSVGLWTDIKILMRTAREVVSKRGVSADGHVTMSEFTGQDVGAGQPCLPVTGDHGVYP